MPKHRFIKNNSREVSPVTIELTALPDSAMVPILNPPLPPPMLEERYSDRSLLSEIKHQDTHTWVFFKGIPGADKCDLAKALHYKKLFPRDVKVYVCEEKYLPKHVF